MCLSQLEIELKILLQTASSGPPINTYYMHNISSIQGQYDPIVVLIKNNQFNHGIIRSTMDTHSLNQYATLVEKVRKGGDNENIWGTELAGRKPNSTNQSKNSDRKTASQENCFVIRDSLCLKIFHKSQYEVHFVCSMILGEWTFKNVKFHDDYHHRKIDYIISCV